MNPNRLDLYSLALFCHVARSGSISQGAKLSALALGAASRRISDLEDAVGTSLFQRHSRGVTVTVAGQALHEHAQQILKGVDNLAADLSDYAAGLVGVVRLWANTSAVTQFLPADIFSFASGNPGVRIELEEADSSDIVMAVVDGRADLGIFADRTPAHGLQLLEYRKDQLVLIVPRGHALSRRRSVKLADTLDHDFVSLSKNTSLAKRLQLETAELGRTLKVRIHVRSFDGICQMVSAGMGIAILPKEAVRPFLNAMNLRQIPLDESWAVRSLLIGVRASGAVPRHVRMVIDHLCNAPGTQTPA
ncbi:MAG: LysR family transcriptional regulator [Pseudomonadota bacterium]